MEHPEPPPFAETYQPEVWSFDKSLIYRAQESLRKGIGNTRELLTLRDRHLGRETRSDTLAAERLDQEILEMERDLKDLTPEWYPTPPENRK